MDISKIQKFHKILEQSSYVSDDLLCTALTMAEQLSRPLLLEGAAGVGKTFLAAALAKGMDRELIRLQCYEGLDASQALYEWNYQKQILSIASHKDQGDTYDESSLFTEEYLLERPLLKAIRQEKSPILLIDEIDRADEEFEAFLLELLADYQITIPEMGVIKAQSIPTVILTSNGTRELSDALRRRCLFHYIDYPDAATEVRIIQSQVPGCSAKLASEIASFIQNLRREDLKKVPGIAETLDWAATLVGMNVDSITDDIEVMHTTLMCVLKTREDREAVPVEIYSKLAERAI